MATPRPAAPLLTPSLGNAERLDRPPGERPWRLQSQFLLSFYGGVLPLTWIAYKNAGRLGLPRQTQIKIAAAGAGMMLLLIAIIVVIFANHDLAVAWLGGERKAGQLSRQAADSRRRCVVVCDCRGMAEGGRSTIRNARHR